MYNMPRVSGIFFRKENISQKLFSFRFFEIYFREAFVDCSISLGSWEP